MAQLTLDRSRSGAQGGIRGHDRLVRQVLCPEVDVRIFGSHGICFQVKVMVYDGNIVYSIQYRALENTEEYSIFPEILSILVVGTVFLEILIIVTVHFFYRVVVLEMLSILTVHNVFLKRLVFLNAGNIQCFR